MSFPEFFSRVPEVTLFDPLAALLGASSDGHIRYRYEDAVRLAGHSCPTVAGTYVLASRMLRRLYPDGPAQRGSLRVEFRRGEAEGTVGVQAAVFGLLTGAAGPGGFKGLGWDAWALWPTRLRGGGRARRRASETGTTRARAARQASISARFRVTPPWPGCWGAFLRGRPVPS